MPFGTDLLNSYYRSQLALEQRRSNLRSPYGSPGGSENATLETGAPRPFISSLRMGSNGNGDPYLYNDRDQSTTTIASQRGQSPFLMRRSANGSTARLRSGRIPTRTPTPPPAGSTIVRNGMLVPANQPIADTRSTPVGTTPTYGGAWQRPQTRPSPTRFTPPPTTYSSYRR